MRFSTIQKSTGEMTNTQRSRLFSAAFWKSVFKYFGGGGPARGQVIADRDSLETFIRTRAAHVAQTALYGYLRTRAGTRFPELFTNDGFSRSINIAKWHVWLACLSDLAIYAGGLLRGATHAPAPAVRHLMQEIIDGVLRETGTPVDSGMEYGSHADRVRSRIALCEWTGYANDDAAFSESPAALVHWAPVADNLKELDEEIVRNSIRFRWHEVRRELRGSLDAAAVLASGDVAAATGETSTDRE